MEQITITLTYEEMVELNAAFKKMLLYGAKHSQKAMDAAE